MPGLIFTPAALERAADVSQSRSDWFAQHAPPSASISADPPASNRFKALLSPAGLAAMGDAGDLVTTQLAMAKGAHETNPMLPSGRLGNAVVQAAEAAVSQYLLHRFGSTHPTLAKLFGGSVGAVGAYSTLRNIQAIQAQDRYHESGGLR